MEYQKIIVFLDNSSNQSSQFRTKNGAEINDDSQREQNTNSQIRFKINFFFKSILCNYRHAYIIVKRIITKTEEGGDHAANPFGKKNKGIIFKNRVPFTDCSRKISSTEKVNAIDLKNCFADIYFDRI